MRNAGLYEAQAGIRIARRTIKQKTAYEMVVCDWSSDVCSSDLICWIMEKARGFQENIYFCFIDYAKAFDCVDHNKLWTILKEMG